MKRLKSAQKKENNTTMSSSSGAGAGRGQGTVSIKTADLNTYLVCKLCDGYFRNAMSIRECLHTFCRSCLTKKIQGGAKNCPTCGQYMGGNALAGCILDRTMQAVVDSIFPDLAKKDAEDRANFYADHGIQKKAVKMKMDEQDRLDALAAQEAEQHDYQEIVRVLPEESGLTPAELLPGLSKPSLKVRMSTKTKKLRSFVYKRIKKLMEQDETMEAVPIENIIFKCDGEYIDMEDQMHAVKQSLWTDKTEPLTFYYHKRL